MFFDSPSTIDGWQRSPKG